MGEPLKGIWEIGSKGFVGDLRLNVLLCFSMPNIILGVLIYGEEKYYQQFRISWGQFIDCPHSFYILDISIIVYAMK